MALAARGLRDMDSGPEEIPDEEVRRAVKSQARTLHVQALLWAAAFTLVVLLLP